MKKILVSILALVAIATTAGAQGNSINGHEYVDLGLPSGLLWATCNVGATEPEDFGDRFAWGETEPKKNYVWSTYKWGTLTALTKYTSSDGLTVLEAADDAATANWGANWRMPTKDEFQELLDNTTNEWTKMNNINGRKFTAKNGKSIFLPASGYFDGKYITYPLRVGFYWSSSRYASNHAQAHDMPFTEGSEASVEKYDRYYGLCIRPVVNLGIAITDRNFPDQNFRSYVSTNFDKDKNGYLSDEEIAAVTEINVLQKNISDLTGIHHFTKLKTLNCTENNLTSLDVSANTELTTLYCSINQLSALDVSNNKKLTTLYCYYNQIGKDAMQTLVDDLPTVSDRQFRAINMDGINNGKEKNFISPEQVKAAKNKGWNVWGKCDVDGTFKWQEFAGAVTITATPNNADYGTVTGAGVYEKGRNVTLKATPKTGYKFVKWTENGTQVSTNATYTFTADGDKTYTAVFEKEATDPKTLSVTFTKATTLLTELSKQDLNVLAAVVFLAQSGLLSNYSVVDNTSMGVRTITLKKGRTPRDSKILFVMNPNKGITVPSDVTSADNINVTLTPDLRKALEQADLATQLAGYDAIQIKFDTTTGLTAVEGGQLTVDSWYSIDGKKLNGEPTKKGVYIIKGKKVKK